MNKKEELSESKQRQNVAEYILGTLLYTPLSYIKNQQYVEIMVYPPGISQPAMKIFRMIIRCNPLPDTPEGCLEVAFQDEVSFRSGKSIDYSNRWQVNFSIFVNKDTYMFSAIHKQPESVERTLESIRVFEEMVQQKNATLYAGDWRFESDGQRWVPLCDTNQQFTSPVTAVTQGLTALPQFSNTTKRLLFEKEATGKWYVVLPEWTGSKDDLEMVAGADSMLDVFSAGKNLITLDVATEMFEGSTHTLSLKKRGEGEDTGATYIVDGGTALEIWLCEVTTFVLGDFPDMLYVKIIQ